LPDLCTLIPRGATFDSIECRLAELDGAVATLGNVDPSSVVASRLGKVIELEQRARGTCRGGDARRTGKQLKAAFRKLQKVRALLSSKKGRKLPGSAALAADIDDIRGDLKSLKKAVKCPLDATPH